MALFSSALYERAQPPFLNGVHALMHGTSVHAHAFAGGACVHACHDRVAGVISVRMRHAASTGICHPEASVCGAPASQKVSVHVAVRAPDEHSC